ncbi:MAG: hypothetical protein H5T92_11065 [Synergistales bacterium]|nr:hypothetical protein [Synergistales bacterium]
MPIRKSVTEEYRTLLNEIVRNSGRTQREIAEEAEMEPANLNHLCSGRRPPLLDPEKNWKLAVACGAAHRFGELQLAAESFHAITKMPPFFRRYMVVLTRTLEMLLERMEQEATAIEDIYIHEKEPVNSILIPESLLAARKVVNSLKYWWPPEEFVPMEEYQKAMDSTTERVSKFPPEELCEEHARAELLEAIEWVREKGDLDPDHKLIDLIKELAYRIGVEEEPLRRIVLAVADAVSMKTQGRSRKAPVRRFSLNDE